jgi:hypothetical protein
MEDNKIKHLEFLQNIITRMNSNSFSIKEWAVTISSASIGIFVASKENNFTLIGIFAVFIFWFLDSFYLHQEKKYRDLYNDVIKIDSAIPIFNLNASVYKKGFCEYFKVVFSKTILPLYFSMFILLLIVFLFLKLQ